MNMPKSACFHINTIKCPNCMTPTELADYNANAHVKYWTNTTSSNKSVSPNTKMSEEELQETAMNLWSSLFGNSTVAKGNSQGHVYYMDFYKLLEQYTLTKQLEARIDENENWARHIGAAWDNEVVNHEDVHKRLRELKAKLTANKSKE